MRRQQKKIDRRLFFAEGMRLATGLTLGVGASRAVTGSAQSKALPVSPRILLVWCDGGWDQTMVFDSKIGMDGFAQEDGASLATTAGGMSYVDHPSRPSVKVWMETFASQAAFVNGVSCGSMTRDAATLNLLATLPQGKTRRCDWLTFYAAQLAAGDSMAHTVIDAPWMPGDFTASTVKLSSERLSEILAPIPGTTSFGKSGESALLEFRKKAFIKMQSQGRANLDGDKIRALYHGFIQQAPLAENIAAITQTLDTTLQAERSFVRHGKLAVELFANGLSQCVSLRCGEARAWDTTSNHFARASQLYEDLFADLGSIMEYARQRGVLDNTIVLVMSERGRSPRLNAAGGKTAWPYTSVLLWGGAIAGNVVAGETDAALRGVPLNPIFGGPGNGAIVFQMANIMSGLFAKAGIPTGMFTPAAQPIAKILR